VETSLVCQTTISDNGLLTELSPGMALLFWYGGHRLIDGEITAMQLWVVFLGVISGGEAAGEFFANANGK
jgi:hypothetical protein